MKPSITLILGISAILLSNNTMAHPHGQIPIPLEEQEKPNATTATLRIGAIPLIPAKARRSGFCCMVYDVTADGIPENISTSFCTNPKFRKISIHTLKQWRFNPAILNGVNIRATNQSSTVIYRLNNRRGQFIPDRKKLMVHNGDIEFSRNTSDSLHERVCINGER